MATLAAIPDFPLKQDWSRLLVACSLSLLLHLALLLGVPVNPTGGVSNAAATIHARLEPAANSERQHGPQEAALTLPKKMAAPASEEAQPESVAAKVEPKRESKPTATEIPASPSGDTESRLTHGPTYYPAKQLDVYPQPLMPIKLTYPDAAAAQRIDGRLLLLLLIDEFGVVNEVSVVEAQPEGHFEEAALPVFRATRFFPAQKQGHPVKSRVLLQVNYIYGDSEGTVR